jgi:hypothetical protein
MGGRVVDKRGGGRGKMRVGMEMAAEADGELAGVGVRSATKRDGGEEVRKWQIKGLTRCECFCRFPLYR